MTSAGSTAPTTPSRCGRSTYRWGSGRSRSGRPPRCSPTSIASCSTSPSRSNSSTVEVRPGSPQWLDPNALPSQYSLACQSRRGLSSRRPSGLRWQRRGRCNAELSACCSSRSGLAGGAAGVGLLCGHRIRPLEVAHRVAVDLSRSPRRCSWGSPTRPSSVSDRCSGSGPSPETAASVASGNGWVTGDRYNAGVANRDRTLVVAIQHEEYTE